MSCYTRHLRDQIRAVGLPDDPSGRKEADRRIRAGLNLAEAHCPEVWRRIKELAPGGLQYLLELVLPSTD